MRLLWLSGQQIWNIGRVKSKILLVSKQEIQFERQENMQTIDFKHVTGNTCSSTRRSIQLVLSIWKLRLDKFFWYNCIELTFLIAVNRFPGIFYVEKYLNDCNKLFSFEEFIKSSMVFHQVWKLQYESQSAASLRNGAFFVVRACQSLIWLHNSSQLWSISMLLASPKGKSRVNKKTVSVSMVKKDNL